ncbi:MAG: slipin family protein [Myxococcota bacterium]
MRIQVSLAERVIVHLNRRPERYLGPGVHSVWAPFKEVELVRLNTDALITDLRPEQLALVPKDELRVLSVGETERALVKRKGRPLRWLGAGEHQIWTVDPSTKIEVIDVGGIEAKPLADELRPLVPATDYVEVTAAEGQVILRWVNGALEKVLGAGRAAAWNVAQKVVLSVIDVRERVLAVNAQEVMTKDRVTLRLNLSVTFKVADPRRLAIVAREPDEVVYLALQLAARDAVGSRSLDELLGGRESLTEILTPAVTARAEAVGLAVVSVGVKDLILPGEMKTLLNRVIEAQKEAEANVILRREETAAVRSMAQTAKVLGESPLLLRLKELEAYKDLAAKVGTVNLVLGDASMQKLELKLPGS